MPGKCDQVARRFHASTWIVAAGAFLALLLANLAAQTITEADTDATDKFSPRFSCRTHYEHGWPASFMHRESHYWPPKKGIRTVPPWSIHRGVTYFNIIGLLADLLVATAFVALVGLGFEAWRRRRRSVFRWHLKDVFAAVTAACVCCGWLAAERAGYQSEMECLRLMNQLDANRRTPIEQAADWQEGGPWWLRGLFGDRCFRQFDRVVKIDLFERGQLRLVPQLKRLQAVGLLGTFEADELAALKELPELIAVETNFSLVEDETDVGSFSGDALLAILSAVTQLRAVDLAAGDTKFSAHALEQLKTLRNLQALNLARTNADDQGLSCLESMDDLRTLSLSSTKLTDGGMRHFNRLSQLEHLALDETQITDSGLAMLPPLPHLRSLNLWNTRLTETSVLILSKMKDLEYLNIMQTSIPESDVDELQQALPNCRIEW